MGATSWREALSREEIQDLLRTDNWRGWLSVLLDWAMVAAAMALVAWSPNLLTVLVALFLIGARQLGFAVLMHEASHHTLFKNRKLNDFVGNWLCAYPIWADLRPYRPYHLRHHSRNWTDEDPDLDLATKFPVDRASLRRKIWRDLSGQVGWKRARAILKRDLGGAVGKTRRDTSGSFGKIADGGMAGWENLRGVIVTNGVLIGILAALGHVELYLLWVVAWLTTYSFVTRVRAIAEHSMPTDRSNEMQNTRTTITRWWERLFIAPNHVGYHLEHHLLMTVPLYNLPRMHHMLKQRGALDDALVTTGYPGVLALASSKAPA